MPDRMTRWRALRLSATIAVAESACLGQGALKQPPLTKTAAQVAAGSLDAAARQQIVGELARQLEAKYLIPEDGARMAAMFRERLAAR
jgi:hypothetical protein